MASAPWTPAIEVIKAPVADGGDGLLAVAAEVLGAQRRRYRVSGPLLRPVEATMGLGRDQSNRAHRDGPAGSGLTLLAADELDPEATTTFGTGELMRAALDLGAERIIIGIGGSATNDGGIGMASALGWRFLGEDGSAVAATGGGLAELRRIDGR